MDENHILEFLDTYKKLDELCRQLFSSEKGVSQYIDEMSNEGYGKWRVAGWESDYKRLKNIRWIRNRLVHDRDSFERDIANEKDIEWMQTFYQRIMECTDSFSLLCQTERRSEETAERTESRSSTHTAFSSQNEGSQDRDIILPVLILAGVMLVGIILATIVTFEIFL